MQAISYTPAPPDDIRGIVVRETPVCFFMFRSECHSNGTAGLELSTTNRPQNFICGPVSAGHRAVHCAVVCRGCRFTGEK